MMLRHRPDLIQRFALVLAIMLLCSGILPNKSLKADENDPARAIEQINAIWSHFESLQCRSTELSENDPGPENDGTITIDFSWKIDGQSALSWEKQQSNGTTYMDTREDGAKSVNVQYFKTQPKTIDRIGITRPSSGPNHYGGLGFAGLRIILPGGRTIASLLQEGATLENTSSFYKPRWVLKAKVKDDTYECVLDESHQFLPKEMILNTKEDRQVLHVDRFDQVDGYCYPVEGTRVFTSLKDDSRVKISFRLENVSFNRFLPDQAFQWTDFPAGVAVTDQIERSMRTVGGKLARLNLQAAHPVPKSSPPTSDPIRVEQDPTSWTSALSLFLSVGVAVIAGSLGVFLWRRGY